MVTIKTKQTPIILVIDRGTYVPGLEITGRIQIFMCLANVTCDDLEVKATGIISKQCICIRTLWTKLCCVKQALLFFFCYILLHKSV